MSDQTPNEKGINWLERAEKLHHKIHNWIGGRYMQPGGGHAQPKYSARDGRLLYEVREGHAADVDQAVSNSREAFLDGRWSRLPVRRKKQVLFKLADLLEANIEQLALLECLDVGKPIGNALQDDVPAALNALREAAEGADKTFTRAMVDGSAPNLSYESRKPLGVVGAIVGWNYPLALAAMKVGPALAMGNSVVLKPSEFTSLSAGRLAELALEAGVPDGVFNVIHGRGSIVGDALARHKDVDLLTFTGSSATGKRLMVAAGESNMKRLMLECGGKSPYIVFEDCHDNLDFIAQHAVRLAFANQGELCAAGTRLLIHKDIADSLLPKLVAQSKSLAPQDPLEPNTTFGALINEAHITKVLGYIESGKQDGANLILAGRRVEPVKGGYYLEPSVFADVRPHFRIAREEIFGPVLSVLTFETEDEAVRLANDSSYGLAAFVSTTALGRAQRLGQRLNAGAVVVYGGTTISEGGVDLGIEPQKESGFGKERGLDGLVSYATSTSVHILI